MYIRNTPTSLSPSIQFSTSIVTIDFLREKQVLREWGNDLLIFSAYQMPQVHEIDKLSVIGIFTVTFSRQLFSK